MLHVAIMERKSQNKLLLVRKVMQLGAVNYLIKRACQRESIFSGNNIAQHIVLPLIYIAQLYNCSLSLWRVVRGSKLMHLDLIHGLFIT